MSDRYFIQQNDHGDLMWLDDSKSARYAAEQYAKDRKWVPLYVEIPEPAVMRSQEVAEPSESRCPACTQSLPPGT